MKTQCIISSRQKPLQTMQHCLDTLLEYITKNTQPKKYSLELE